MAGGSTQRADDDGIDRAREAARRWAARAAPRQAKSDAVAEGRYTDADTPGRLQARLERLGRWARAVTGDESAAPVAREDLTDELVERMIGTTDDLLSVEFFELGSLAAASVGRIVTDGRPNGTGFVVAPGLVLTNQHVLPDPATATTSTFELDFEDNRVGTPKRVEVYRIRPDEFFLADAGLDFALVGVAPTSGVGTPLDRFGTLPLIGEEGKARIGEPVDVVQHPGGGVKKIVIRNNTLLDLPDTPGMTQYFHYSADTEKGSSGSPVFNDQWEVVALHHQGVPKTDAGGNPVDANGVVLHRGDAEDRFVWVANEGIRVSKIVAAVAAAALPPAMAARRDAALGDWRRNGDPGVRERVAPAPAPDPVPAPLGSVPAGAPVPAGDASVEVTVPVRLAVSVRVAGTEQAAVPPSAPESARPDPTDPLLLHRPGYDPGFLGATVPLPVLADAAHGPLAVVDGGGNELRYHHFSVLMNARRRLAYVAAVNVDARAPFHHQREGADRWFLDPRLPAAEQADNTYYDDNPLDRGHLVRRDDAAWGATAEEARLGSDDTFHWTNCSPQHEIYNQPAKASQLGLMLWGGLERAVSRLATRHGGRLAVFNGPVFTDTDRPYRQDFWVPREFWKLVVVRADDGSAEGALRACAFRLSQADEIADLPREGFRPAELAGYAPVQVPVSELEAVTGLDFGPVRAWDALGGGPRESLGGRRVLTSEADIVFSGR